MNFAQYKRECEAIRQDLAKKDKSLGALNLLANCVRSVWQSVGFDIMDIDFGMPHIDRPLDWKPWMKVYDEQLDPLSKEDFDDLCGLIEAKFQELAPSYLDGIELSLKRGATSDVIIVLDKVPL